MADDAGQFDRRSAERIASAIRYVESMQRNDAEQRPRRHRRGGGSGSLNCAKLRKFLSGLPGRDPSQWQILAIGPESETGADDGECTMINLDPCEDEPPEEPEE